LNLTALPECPNIDFGSFIDPFDEFKPVACAGSLAWSHMTQLVGHPSIMARIVELVGASRIPAWWNSRALPSSPDYSDGESAMWTSILNIVRKQSPHPAYADISKVINPSQLAAARRNSLPLGCCNIQGCENRDISGSSQTNCNLCSPCGMCLECRQVTDRASDDPYETDYTGNANSTKLMRCGHPRSSRWFEKNPQSMQVESLVQAFFGKTWGPLGYMLAPYTYTLHRGRGLYGRGDRDVDEQRHEPTGRIVRALHSLESEYPRHPSEAVLAYLLRLEGHRSEAEARTMRLLSGEVTKYTDVKDAQYLLQRCAKRLRWVVIGGRVCCAVHPLMILRSEAGRLPANIVNS